MNIVERCSDVVKEIRVDIRCHDYRHVTQGLLQEYQACPGLWMTTMCNYGTDRAPEGYRDQSR